MDSPAVVVKEDGSVRIGPAILFIRQRSESDGERDSAGFIRQVSEGNDFKTELVFLLRLIQKFENFFEMLEGATKLERLFSVQV
jgi:hypothetical protein